MMAVNEVDEVSDLLYDADICDQQLRKCARQITDAVTEFNELIERARSLRVHELLAGGFPSWTAYISDVIDNEMGGLKLDVDTRRALVDMLTVEGMSQRAIAKALHVDQSTVSRDLQESGDASRITSGTTTIGLDGKEYPPAKRSRKPKPPKPANPFTAGILNDVEEIKFRVNRLQIDVQDRRFQYHRDRLIKLCGDDAKWSHETLGALLRMLTVNDQSDLFDDGAE